MSYIPLTPFGRAMSVEVIDHHRRASTDLPNESVNKYDVLRELTVVRKTFGLSDRALSVLQALLSFHPETELGESGRTLTVFPSNKSICERLNGMACSTMRRHLAALVDAGLILRRDSPNGKRFVKRYKGTHQAFGFDLTPLVTRFAEVQNLAEVERQKVEQLDRLKRSVSLMRRDLAGLAELGAQMHPDRALWDAFSDGALLAARELRKKLSLEELEVVERKLRDLLDQAKAAFDLTETEELSTSDTPSEQHHHNSNKEINRSEKSKQQRKIVTSECNETISDGSNVPIQVVRASCREISNYSDKPIAHWMDLIGAAQNVVPMMGLSRSVWNEAVEVMGRVEAAIVVACMLERFAEIKVPNAYLKALSRKARAGRFSSGPMVMALARQDAA